MQGKHDDGDGDPPKKKTAYKLPHRELIDGRLQVVRRGVTHAMNVLARFPVIRGPSPADNRACGVHGWRGRTGLRTGGDGHQLGRG
jgi:hypothetical protein